jgi:hypothetical protein
LRSVFAHAQSPFRRDIELSPYLET